MRRRVRLRTSARESLTSSSKRYGIINIKYSPHTTLIGCQEKHQRVPPLLQLRFDLQGNHQENQVRLPPPEHHSQEGQDDQETQDRWLIINRNNFLY